MLRIHENRITECLGLEGTSVGHVVQPPCQSTVTYSRLHTTLSRREQLDKPFMKETCAFLDILRSKTSFCKDTTMSRTDVFL